MYDVYLSILQDEYLWISYRRPCDLESLDFFGDKIQEPMDHEEGSALEFAEKMQILRQC